MPTPAADVLAGWVSAPFTADVTHDVYTRGSGPGVVLLPEIPGLTPQVMGLADHLVDAGFTVAVPSLFGEPGRPLSGGYALRTIAKACITKEFAAFARNPTGRSPSTCGRSPGTCTARWAAGVSASSACASAGASHWRRPSSPPSWRR